jgi:hypothetical protein
MLPGSSLSCIPDAIYLVASAPLAASFERSVLLHLLLLRSIQPLLSVGWAPCGTPKIVGVDHARACDGLMS